MKDNKETYAMISARIKKEEKDIYDSYCQDKDMSISQFIRAAIKEYMQNHQ